LADDLCQVVHGRLELGMCGDGRHCHMAGEPLQAFTVPNMFRVVDADAIDLIVLH
jgi:hypothetical protein